MRRAREWTIWGEWCDGSIVAANALLETYQHLKDTGLLNINARQVADLRRRVEELISLPEYYEVEAATTEKGSTVPGGHP